MFPVCVLVPTSASPLDFVVLTLQSGCGEEKKKDVAVTLGKTVAYLSSDEPQNEEKDKSKKLSTLTEPHR